MIFASLISAWMVWFVGAAGSGDPILDWLAKAGAPGILALVVIGFMRGDVVSGKEHRRVLGERDRAVDIIYRQLSATHRAVDVSAESLSIQAELMDRQRGGVVDDRSV